MKRLAVLVGITSGLVLGTGTAAAQQAIWIPPACKLNTKHFLVNSAQLYLKNATQAKNADQRASNLRDAGRVLNEAVTTGGQADNPAAWYFFGRYYALVEDMPGADSTFRRAQEKAPDCADDIEQYRRQAWVPEIQAAAEALNKADFETAKVHFRKANAIYQGDPLGFYYLANVFTNESQIDSGIVYYRRSVQTVHELAGLAGKGDSAVHLFQQKVVKGDTTHADTYETSVFNLARLYHQQAQSHHLQQKLDSATVMWDSATVWYQNYLVLRPNDMQAVSGLAVVYDGAAETAKEANNAAKAEDYKARASKLYEGILAKADEVPFLDLFSTGITLFRSGDYARAVQAFQAVVKKSPYYRDALYNLASTYLSMGSMKDTTLTQAARDAEAKRIGEEMLPIAKRMVEVDGYNRNTLRMLAVAFQYLGMNDSVLAMLTAAEGLPFEVNIGVFQQTQSGHQVRGTVTALQTEPLKVVSDSLKMVSEWIPKLGDTLQTVNKSLQTGRDARGRVVPATIKQALQQQLPKLKGRQDSLATAKSALEKRRADLVQAGVQVPPITFEFLNQGGQVVASQTVPGMALKANESKEFELAAVGEGIVSWRYKVGA
ncbi:MAG: hypothetical protein HY560_07260 [Gemmatimonadetes bacterium]|nr:hypothetical protein [Gemmatimonadota bacterium]